MSVGIKTLEAADNGISAITKTIESMQSTLRQARQDKSFKTASYTVPTTAPAVADDVSFSGGAVGTTPVNVNLGSTSLTTSGNPTDGVTGDQFTVTHNGVSDSRHHADQRRNRGCAGDQDQQRHPGRRYC